MTERSAENDRYGFLSSDGYPEEGPNPLIKPLPSAENGEPFEADPRDCCPRCGGARRHRAPCVQPAENDAETYCGAEYGEVREGECECPRHTHPDPLQDWPMPGHLKPDAKCDHNEKENTMPNAVDRERLASVLYRMNGHAWYGRDLGDWDDPESRIGRNEDERDRWYRQADALLLAVEPNRVDADRMGHAAARLREVLPSFTDPRHYANHADIALVRDLEARVIPPGGCGICGKPLSEVGASQCYEAHGVLPPALPIHRTEAGYPNCATCDGGGCLDCTDPA